MLKSQTGPISDQGVSIIIPVYNEAVGLPGFVSDLQEFIQSCSYPLEIVFVDDGSDDGTVSLLDNESFTVIQHETNMGYGAAIKTGLEHTKHETIVILDADGTYSPSDILAVVEPMGRYDMVVGARMGNDVNIPLSRRPAKWMIRVFATWMVRRAIPDLNSGLRAFRRSTVNKIFRLLPDGFSLTTTLTVAFHTQGSQVYYTPVQYRTRSGTSKFRPIADTWNMFLLILRTVVLIRPLNVFLPLSFFLAALAIAVLIISKFFMGKFMDATFIVLMMTSIQMFVLGLIADLIVRINLWTH